MRAQPTLIALAITASVLLPARAQETGRAATGPEVRSALLRDGTRLVTVRVPGAPTSALRYVVHSGALADPPGRSGLAHLLEHAIFQGSHTTTARDLRHLVWRSGGEFNAATGFHATIYRLDAPGDAFLELIGRFLPVLTSPALTLVDLQAEKGVIRTENELTPENPMAEVLNGYLYPGHTGIIGTDLDREASSHEDLTAFHQAHYTPANTTLLVVGDHPHEVVARTIEASSRLAPSDDPAPAASVTPPVLPIRRTITSSAEAIVYGLGLGRPRPGVCESLAEVLSLRLQRELVVDRLRASSVSVECSYAGPDALLVARVLARQSTADRLLQDLRRHFQRLGSAPTSPAERSLTTGHRRASRRVASAFPAEWADTLAWRIGATDPGALSPEALLWAPEIDPQEAAASVQGAFALPQELVLRFTSTR